MMMPMPLGPNAGGYYSNPRPYDVSIHSFKFIKQLHHWWVWSGLMTGIVLYSSIYIDMLCNDHQN